MAVPPQPTAAIADYGLLGDCASAALVSRWGSIDWFCAPRFDSGSVFARMLDRDGGYCSLAPVAIDQFSVTRRYIEQSSVLETGFSGPTGRAVVRDCMVRTEAVKPEASARGPRIVRIVEGIEGEVEFALRVVPRFDYGAVRPWMRRYDEHGVSAIGGSDALRIWCEPGFAEDQDHEVSACFTVAAGERRRVLLQYCRPEDAVDEPPAPEPSALDAELDETVRWWSRWAETIMPASDAVTRSALVLKALTFARTGAIIAAPTTSLPEAPGGERNWDYRYAWIRDATLCSRALTEVDCHSEADAFHAFIMRSAAGHVDDLQVLYGIGGERRISPDRPLDLAGREGATPVRLGNAAAHQVQLDCYGEIVNLCWRWHARGNSLTADEWGFLVSLIDAAADTWQQPDCGIWEWPGEPDHFVHSKVMCWSAVDRGITIAEALGRPAPIDRWRAARDEIHEAIEARGFDSERGIYVQAFDRPELDAALLLLPTTEYLAWDDERMRATIAAIQEELGLGNGLLRRYRRDDGLDGEEGAFLACSFWLVEALARGGDRRAAARIFRQATARANDLGLFAEQFDPERGRMAGNFPQALSHLAHIAAAVALSDGGKLEV